MRAVGRILLLAVVLVGVYFFWRRWSSTTSWGTGTGYYARKTDKDKSGTPEQSRLQKVAADPSKYVGKKITLSGRVFQPERYASNRNIYTLVSSNGESRVLVIDDKAIPQEYYVRTVSGVLKQVPTTNWLYLVDVKGGVKVDTPTVPQVKTFFTTKYDEARSEVNKALKNVDNEIR